MTAPAPEYETWMWAEMGRLQDALAAVTAERDQAVENARASQQMHEDARQLLDETLTERDELRTAVLYAPHGPHCNLSGVYSPEEPDCNCWKAGL
jgi:hypothetical protein